MNVTKSRVIHEPTRAIYPKTIFDPDEKLGMLKQSKVFGPVVDLIRQEGVQNTDRVYDDSKLTDHHDRTGGVAAAGPVERARIPCLLNDRAAVPCIHDAACHLGNGPAGNKSHVREG